MKSEIRLREAVIVDDFNSAATPCKQSDFSYKLRHSENYILCHGHFCLKHYIIFPVAAWMTALLFYRT